MGYSKIEPLFPLGEILISSGVMNHEINIMPFLRRHQSGDWGDQSVENDKINEHALSYDLEILSQYHISTHKGKIETVIIMTENDRSRTVVFIAGELESIPTDNN